MVAATLFGELLGPPGNPYRGNSYELASIRVVGIRKGMSKPGSEPRGTASDEFPTRRVVTVTCKHQISSGSSHRLRCQGKRVGRVCSDWLLDSRRDESRRAAIRLPLRAGTTAESPTGRAGQLDRGLGFRDP